MAKTRESAKLTSLVKDDEGEIAPVSTGFTGVGRKNIPRDELIEAIRKTRGLLYLASNVLGVNHVTLSKLIEADEELSQIWKEEKGKTLDRAEAKLMQAVDKGEQWAITMILRTLGRERGYVERQEVASMSHVKLEIVEEIVDSSSKAIQIKASYKSPSLPENFVEDKDNG